MNNFIQELETLKKEVWFLKNKTIKKIIEELSSIGGGGVDSTLTERIKNLESATQTLENNLKTLQAEVSENSENLVDVSEHVGQLADVIATIQDNMLSLNSEIAELKGTDELLSENINKISDDLAKVQESLENLQSQVGMIASSVQVNSEEIEKLKESDEKQNLDISGIKSVQDSHLNLLNNYEARIGTLENSMTDVQEDISTLEERVSSVEQSGGGSGGDTSALTQQLENHAARIEALESSDTLQNTSIANVETATTANTQSIESLLAKVEEMQTKLNNVKAPVVDVLYDMRSDDASINLGYTSGLVGYTNLTMDFTPYSRVRIFGSLNQCDCQKEIDLVNRYRYDVELEGFANSRKTFTMFRVQIPATKTKFQAVGYSTWTWSDDTSTVTVTHDKTSESIFVYRIEGIKE